MNISKAFAIFDDIDNKEIPDEEKGAAIYEVMSLVSHNGITKAQMMRVIKYLFWLCFEPEQIDEKERSDNA